jgi:hypothetical protein
MQLLTSANIGTWKISYNPYTDFFQIFSETIFRADNKNLFSKKEGDAVLVFEKSTKKPLMVEFVNVYECIGDVDNMSKEDIIQRVIGYVNNHG